MVCSALSWTRQQPTSESIARRSPTAPRLTSCALANGAMDLSIKLPLTERVVVTAKDGGYDITHAPEPVIDR
ncbi:phage tail protein [Xanthomonas citri pv. malvacearum]|uniref:phage tail protein n=1 Tax=Xanthomonas TaxID=338 RepID=UPI001E3D01C8|nr:phage tail protein [Xanthomonas citri]